MRNRIMSILLTIFLVLIGCYQSSCIQTKQYRWEPSEYEKRELIDRAAQKMAEQHEKEKK